ncbi:MAG: UPF0175 family protein [Magnetococcales bacterium]|nr:UPF0175 family protein [Magnetococcales bacterium]
MPTHQIVIPVPENIPIPQGIDEDPVFIRNALAVVLYKNGRLTLLQARELMGLTRREFEECLPEYGFTMMDDKDLNSEIESIDKF